MAVPYATYVAEAGKLDFVVPFPFLNRSHVLVRANGVLQSLAPWPGPSMIRLLLPVAIGSLIEIERVTPLDGPLVSFQNGNVLTSEDLNTAILQLLYRQQELAALYNRTVGAAKIRIAELGGVTLDTDKIFDELVAKILEGEAFNALQDRITDIDANASAILNEINARLADVAEIDARITTEQTTRADADEALAETFNALQARVEDAEASIAVEQTARADGDSANAQTLAVLQARVEGAEGAIINEQQVRADVDAATASNLTVLQGRVDGAEGALATETQARVSADEVIVDSVESLRADVEGNTSALDRYDRVRADDDDVYGASLLTLMVGFDKATARFMEEVRANADDTGAAVERITTLEADYTALSADIGTVSNDLANAYAGLTTVNAAIATTNGELDAVAVSLASTNTTLSSLSATVVANEQARVSSEGAIASTVSGVQTQVNGLSSSVQTVQGSLNGVLAKYGVTLNSNGHITGFSQNNDGTTGSFTVVADLFRVVTPDGSSYRTPFTVTADGVRIDGNLMVTGSITSPSIANNAVNTVNINFNAVTLPVNSYTEAEMSVPQSAWTTLQNLSITTVGMPIVVAGNAVLRARSSGTFGNRKYQIRILRDSTEIYLLSGANYVSFTSGDCYAPMGVYLNDQPSAGTHTYQLQIYLNDRDEYVSRRSLTVCEMRR